MKIKAQPTYFWDDGVVRWVEGHDPRECTEHETCVVVAVPQSFDSQGLRRENHWALLYLTREQADDLAAQLCRRR